MKLFLFSSEIYNPIEFFYNNGTRKFPIAHQLNLDKIHAKSTDKMTTLKYRIVMKTTYGGYWLVGLYKDVNGYHEIIQIKTLEPTIESLHITAKAKYLPEDEEFMWNFALSAGKIKFYDKLLVISSDLGTMVYRKYEEYSTVKVNKCKSKN